MACGGGYGRPARPKGPCDHDAKERHQSAPPTPEEIAQSQTPECCADWLLLAALSDNSNGPWEKVDLFRMAKEAAERIGLTDAMLEAGLQVSAKRRGGLKVSGSKVGL